MERINEEYAALDDAEVTKMLPTWKRYGYVVHVAKLVDEDGNVSPLCAGDAPEPVTLGTRETWVYSPRRGRHRRTQGAERHPDGGTGRSEARGRAADDPRLPRARYV